MESNKEKSIFLIGVKRDGKYEKDWMVRACTILDEENFNGCIYLPEDTMSKEEEL